MMHMKQEGWHSMNNKIDLNDYYRLLELQQKYENNELDLDECTIEDIKKIIALYESQIKNIKRRTVKKLIENGGNYNA